MKKTIAIILAVLILLISLVSCDMQSLDGKTAGEALLIIATRMSGENALKTHLVFNIQMMAFGVPTSVDIDATASSKQVGDKLMLEGNLGISTYGIAVPTSYRVVDGMMYMEITALEEQTRLKAPIDGTNGSALDGFTLETAWNTYTSIKDATIEKSGEKYILKATMLPDALVDEILGNMSGITTEDSEISLSDISVALTVAKDGFCENIKICFNMEIDEINMNCTYEMSFETLPDNFTVTAPEDSDTYTEVDFDELTSYLG